MNDRRDNILVRGKVYRFARFSHRLFRSIIYGPDDKMRERTLLIILCFGLVGILCDLDHFIVESVRMVRPLHIPYFVGFWVVGICYIAFLRRRFHNTGINIKNKQTFK